MNSAVSDPQRLLAAEMPEQALSRCASGEISPEAALLELLAQYGSGEAEDALGTAIWDALEKREAARAERLAQLQRLWDRLRQTVHSAIHLL